MSIPDIRRHATARVAAVRIFEVGTLNLALTSDFPSTITNELVARIRATAGKPRVAWIPPRTVAGRERFHAAQAQFQLLGVSAVEFCDIDEEPNEKQLAHLDEYDVLYFTGGDPLVFSANLKRWCVGDAVRKCLAAGRLVVGASGGAMQFGQNVSLYRLLSCDVERVLAERGEYTGLGLVDYELLPHLNRLDQPARGGLLREARVRRSRIRYESAARVRAGREVPMGPASLTPPTTCRWEPRAPASKCRCRR